MIRRLGSFLRGLVGRRPPPAGAPAGPERAPAGPAPDDGGPRGVPAAFAPAPPEEPEPPPVPIHDDALRACEGSLAYAFRDRTYLRNALTHSSRKSPDNPCNERLEFLGDSVLGLVTTEYIYQKYPDYDEGELTAIKSVVVSKTTLSRVSHSLGLYRWLRVGRGIAARGGLPPSLLANVFEAIVAAIYLDGGMEAARPFILRFMVPEVDTVVENGHRQNFKSLLQQYVQREMHATPVYRVLQERGPEHGKQFCVAVVIRGQRYPAAWGASKKDAEQKAAERSLRSLTRSNFESHLERLVDAPAPPPAARRGLHPHAGRPPRHPGPRDGGRRDGPPPSPRPRHPPPHPPSYPPAGGGT